MKKENPKPQYCGECKYLKELKENKLSFYEADIQYMCVLSNIKVYRDEEACPWGSKK